MMDGFLGLGPAVGVEVGNGVLRAAALRRRRGSCVLEATASAALPPGLVLDSFTAPNITDVAAFVGALKRLSSSLGHRGKTVGVALPDYVSRVSVLDFDSFQGNHEEAERMIRWRLKKVSPFDVEQAALRYQHLGRFTSEGKDQHRVLVSIIKSDILAQYEAAFKAAGLRPRFMGLSSFLLWNFFRDAVLKEAGPGAGFALMNIFGGKLSVMIFDGGAPRFMRLKDLGKQDQGVSGEGQLGITMVLKELDASLTFYKENYSDTRVSRVYMGGDHTGLGGMAEEVNRSTDMKAEVLDLGKVAQAPVSASRPAGGLLAYSAACGAAVEG